MQVTTGLNTRSMQEATSTCPRSFIFSLLYLRHDASASEELDRAVGWIAYGERLAGADWIGVALVAVALVMVRRAEVAPARVRAQERTA